MTSRAAFRSKFSRVPPVDPVANLVSSNTAGLAGALRVALTGLESRLSEAFTALGHRVDVLERAIADLRGLRSQVARLEAKPDPDFNQPLERALAAIADVAARVDRLEQKDVIGPLKSLATAVKAVKAPPDRVSKPLGSIVSLIEEVRQAQIDMRREMADRPELVEREEPELDITELKNVLNQDYEVVRDREGIITGWRPKRG